jgi:hypothetical protein
MFACGGSIRDKGGSDRREEKRRRIAVSSSGDLLIGHLGVVAVGVGVGVDLLLRG